MSGLTSKLSSNRVESLFEGSSTWLFEALVEILSTELQENREASNELKLKSKLLLLALLFTFKEKTNGSLSRFSKTALAVEKFPLLSALKIDTLIIKELSYT